MSVFVSSIVSFVLSVIAIGVAIRASRQASKDASKQIQSIKELSRNQIEAAEKHLEIQIRKYTLLAQQAKENVNKQYEIDNSELAYQQAYRQAAVERHKAQQPQRDLHYYEAIIKELTTGIKELRNLKAKQNKKL